MHTNPRGLTAADMNFLACLADDLAFIQVPLPPGDEEELECSECGSCLVQVLYREKNYCAFHARSELLTNEERLAIPALYFAGSEPSRRRELHGHARRG